LRQSLENVESPIEIGTYDPENNTFHVTITLSSQPISAKVPRELARDFKAQSSSLKAKGQKQMNQSWSGNISIGALRPHGQTFVLGEQRGVGAQVAQLQQRRHRP